MVGPPRPGRFVIRLGDTPGDPLAAEPIADALVVPGRTFGLHAVSPGGGRYGRPGGRATISYDQAAQTLTVTVTAYGLNSGPHAAHIHLGGCQNQGAVKYMLADFTDARGNLINQTRTVTGVASIHCRRLVSEPAPGRHERNTHRALPAAAVRQRHEHRHDRAHNAVGARHGEPGPLDSHRHRDDAHADDAHQHEHDTRHRRQPVTEPHRPANSLVNGSITTAARRSGL